MVQLKHLGEISHTESQNHRYGEFCKTSAFFKLLKLFMHVDVWFAKIFICLFMVFQLLPSQKWLAAYMSEEWYAVWGLPLKVNIWSFKVRVNKAEIHQHRDKEKQMWGRAALKAEFTSCSLLMCRRLSLLWKYPSGLSSTGRVLWVDLGACGINDAIARSLWHS